MNCSDLGLPSGAELGLAGTPWPSAHCPACLSSSSVSAAGEGADSPRQSLPDKWPPGISGACRSAFTPSLGTGGRQQAGMGRSNNSSKETQNSTGRKHPHHVCPATLTLSILFVLLVKTSGCQRAHFNFSLPDFAQGRLWYHL